jgi:hypothetical protein
MWSFLLSSALATVLLDWSLADVLARADLVIVGTIGPQRPSTAGAQLFTDTEVSVDETLYGSKAARIVVSQLGGTRDGVTSSIAGDARLVPGERMLLATYAGTDGRRYLVGMSLGAYAVRGELLSQRIEASLLSADQTLRPGPQVRTTSLTEVRRLLESRSR